MDNITHDLITIIGLGIGATLLMDIWGLARKPLLGISPPNYCLVGRWFGHMMRGQFQHQSIKASKPIQGECFIGWFAHYLTGICFASILIIFWGMSWIEQPKLVPALWVGLGTLAAPFLLMQPCMGAGIAAAKTPNPWQARIQSLVTHLVFGFGLYLAGLLIKFMGT
ncbi:DUF2938 domain-containing protein [Methylophaga sp. OBS1]|uniref:DUF2938 domain-containing protein n=1 Tax=Methylophaga sp. OBS1 TaxID=2991933 RepID=UPI00224DD1EE|nr:DUF2938 domain-containing protein [Methylophaga sp. OBS1]MCX4191136.1 DUF2938 domain-containing protein [Methylophaga sp. OBS1]MCX4191918.1 DUF2938 domain-containing protein [Methylophaga sp. OBS1]